MGLIDTHAHLTFPELSGQIDDILARCREAGVDRVITVGTDLADARHALELADRFPEQVFVAAGFHPHEADKVSDDDLAAMADIWQDDRVVGLGEMGLDYHYDLADRDKQKHVFERQLASAIDRDEPIIIHAREAFADTERSLLDHGFADRRVVFHCFTGTADEAARIAGHGWRISFTGIVTFKKSQWLQEIAKAYPAEKLMVETDAPYLSPMPFRGKYPNEPSRVAHTAGFLAKLRGTPFQQFAEQTTTAAKAFFGV